MVYELYVDSLFVVNTVMNLYLLMLVNRGALRTATRKGMVLGACAGGLIYFIPFLIDLPAWFKWPATLLAGMVLMPVIAFRPGNLRTLLRLIGRLFLYSFLMGGLLLFAGRSFPFLRQFAGEVFGVLGIGALGYLLMSRLQEREQARRRNPVCRAVLVNGTASVTVSALMDSGNSLREPVSGKPVSVISAKLYRALWGEERIPFRAIPYHSIGRSHGIMRGYLLPQLKLEEGGIDRCLCDVYVAVSEEETGADLILNPAVLEETSQRL
ncbi:MAG: sigma-E processing peptidase SpoIIGA [Clostridium sp.]|nr:sigma-E processing peptidase SpoIIGA [Acetatifactor muris]MCM1526079.1 sigma-E processing peptidase SpoIIGA [Bacteroides sp.]MCM1562161.1 sigma-E processing peptidase SpoIIGA [Clostridium sp.]